MGAIELHVSSLPAWWHSHNFRVHLRGAEHCVQAPRMRRWRNQALQKAERPLRMVKALARRLRHTAFPLEQFSIQN